MNCHASGMRMPFFIGVWLGVICALGAPRVHAWGMRGNMEGATYISPRENFRCDVPRYDLGETKINDVYEKFRGTADKYRGTATFSDFFDITRVDFEDFAQAFDVSTLTSDQIERAYTVYFYEQLVPLVKSGVKDASVLSRKFVAGSPAIYSTVMLLPTRDGEQVRGAIEYTDGHAMYIVSVARPTRPELGRSMQKENDEVLAAANAVFKGCRFAVPASKDKGK